MNKLLLLPTILAGLLGVMPAEAGSITRGLTGNNPQQDAKVLCQNYYTENMMWSPIGVNNSNRKSLGRILDLAWEATELQHTGHPSELDDQRSYYRQLKGWAISYCPAYFR